jgi:DNA-binding transcriptional ArsR family regulator
VADSIASISIGHDAGGVNRGPGRGLVPRPRIVAMLRGGELCVCQLTAVLDLAASTVSARLTDLKRAALATPLVASWRRLS